MAQHLWREGRVTFGRIRVCDACDARQITGDPPMEWPRISPICPGDDHDGGRRVIRRRPEAPSGAPRERVLESA